MCSSELLTGTTPFDGNRLRTAGYDEMRRIIREEEPARPSSRVSTLDQAASTVSANRRSDPRRLSRLLRGELDWVVMKVPGEGPHASLRDGGCPWPRTSGLALADEPCRRARRRSGTAWQVDPAKQSGPGSLLRDPDRRRRGREHWVGGPRPVGETDGDESRRGSGRGE